ncbi:hypothetical protein [Tropicimonas sp.]|uniref:hypothetical protein n=1 Tax=Tropicimonas sp. TaxID=2067044 RepID=UPI003A866997
MTEILVIGNSHVASMKTGWDLIKLEYPSVRMEFFAAPVPHFGKLQLTNDGHFGVADDDAEVDEDLAKVMLRLNKRTRISLESFSMVYWAGYPWGLGRIISSLHALNQPAIDKIDDRPAQNRFSLSAFQEICRSAALQNKPSKIWGETLSGRLTLIPMALPSEAMIGNTAPKGMMPWKGYAERGAPISRIFCYYESIFRDMTSEHGINLSSRPDEAIGVSGLTKALYSQGSIRLWNGEPHQENDYSHMNGKYGALVLRDLLDASRGM